jgi:hypothetical protein
MCLETTEGKLVGRAGRLPCPRVRRSTNASHGHNGQLPTVRIASRNDCSPAFGTVVQSIRSSLRSTASVGSRKLSLT